MRALVVDVENTVVWRADGTIDGTPYNPANRLVSAGWGWVRGGVVNPPSYYFFHHKEMEDRGQESFGARRLQAALDEAEVIVAHNAKHDVAWLEEAGFELGDTPIYDTMIGEYVLARGSKIPLSLADTAERYGVTAKKSELIEDYWSRKIGFEAMPIPVVQEYGMADVQSCGEVYVKQLARYALPDNAGLIPTRDMSMEFCRALTSMERAGIAIDEAALARVEDEYRAELAALKEKLRRMVWEVMGDTPVNLASPQQLSEVIYSRRIRDKKEWAKAYNIGTDDRGKPKRRPRMTQPQFAAKVRELSDPIRKTKAVPCGFCKETGQYYKTKKNGEPWAVSNKCLHCKGAKVLYIDQKPGFAGLMCIPTGVGDASDGGFSTSGDVLKKLAARARASNQDRAAELLYGLVRLSAVETYLSNFCGGIRRGLQTDGLLHPKFNQCVTATGRLSSSEPNFQNQPRGKTFPVRRCVVSRFPGGSLIEADFSQLEFRVAGELAKCPGIWAVVMDGRDAHRITGGVIFGREEDEVDDEQRTASKPYTFQPLYGGMGMDEPPHVQAYFRAFATELYPGVGIWHRELVDEACRTTRIRIPTGREYEFPGVRRTPYGCTFRTQIVNYPVQGYATADIVPLSVIRLARAMKARKLRSVLVNTVHDSNVVDCYPGEERAVCECLTWAMLGVVDELRERYGINLLMPLNIEIKRGPNWLDTKVETPIEDWRMAA